MAIEITNAGLLDTWESLPTETVDITYIGTAPELQPRRLDALSGAEARRHRRISEQQQAGAMKALLTQSLDAVLPPLWLVRTPWGFRVVDGHHRLNAYKEAGRTQVPVKIYKGPDAEHLGRLAAIAANNRGSTIPLDAEETRESVWRLLSDWSDYGQVLWPEVSEAQGVTQRSLPDLLGAAHAVKKSTVGNMVKRLPRVAAHLSELPEKRPAWPSWDDARREAFFGNEVRRADTSFEIVQSAQRRRLEDIAEDWTAEAAGLDKDELEECITQLRAKHKVRSRMIDGDERALRHKEDIRCGR